MAKESKAVQRLFEKLISAKEERFPHFREKLMAPTGQGVYVIYNPDGEVVHVGRTPKAKFGIWQRLRNHMSGSSSFKYHYLEGNGALLRGSYTFRCLEVDEPRLRALLEAYAIGILCPKHLGIG